MKFIKILFFLLITLSVSAQKVRIKKGVVYVDKKETLRYEKDDISRGAFYINDLEGNELLYVKWIDIKRSYAEYGYFEIYKADDLDNVLFEEPSFLGYSKNLIMRLYKSEAISKKGLNNENLHKFSKKIGRNISRQRAENKY